MRKKGYFNLKKDMIIKHSKRHAAFLVIKIPPIKIIIENSEEHVPRSERIINTQHSHFSK